MTVDGDDVPCVAARGTSRTARTFAHPEMLIRRLTVADAAAVAPLCTQLDYPSTPDQVAGRLEVLLSSHDEGLLGARQFVVVGFLEGAHLNACRAAPNALTPPREAASEARVGVACLSV